MNKHIQNILAEFEKEFVNKIGKSVQTWQLNEKALQNPILIKNTLTSTYTAGYEEGLIDAEKCVPEEEKKPFISSPESESYMYSLAQFNRIAGHNSCRTITLEGLKKLRNK